MNNRKLKISFIVDGGLKIGLGHVYQSITFARLLGEKAQISFLTKSNEIVITKIEQAGFAAFKFSNDNEILEYINESQPDIVIMDKTDASAEVAKNIKDKKIRLAIFTNITNANRYADVAVTADMGSHFNNIRYLNPYTNTLYFYGPKYWILREEFHQYHKRNKPMPEKVNSILVSFGGSDPANLTTLAAKELLKLPKHSKIDVILGASFGHMDSLNEVLREYKAVSRDVKIHRDVTNVAELMYEADVVIASPGLSAFEALFVRTPILLFPQDQIQRETYQGFMKVIDRENMDSLVDYITGMDFTYPDEEDIINMEIGEGSEEIMNAILGNETERLKSNEGVK